MFCGNCGNSIPAGQHFCLSCGTPARPAASPVPAAPRPASPQPSAPVYTPPQQQPAAYQQPSSYAPPTYAPSGSAAPPALHWALVLVLAFVTGGLFGLIWFFVQASYVKRIDPTSKARMLLVLGLLLSVAQIVISVAGAFLAATGSETVVYAALALSMLILLASMICMLAAVFGMRGSLVAYFNSVEPISLRLSGIMTFFFSLLYFQYHLSRIAEWKRTGVLA